MRRYYRPGVGGGGQRDVSIGTREVLAAAVGENLKVKERDKIKCDTSCNYKHLQHCEKGFLR